MFAKKLKNLKVNVGLDILPGLPHGFLNFSTVSYYIFYETNVKIVLNVVFLDV